MEQVSLYIGVSGGIMAAQFVENFRLPNAKHAQLEPAAFCEPGADIRKPAEIDADIAASYELLCERYDAIKKGMQEGGDLWADVSAARDRWIKPMLIALGYRPQYEAAKIPADDVGSLKFNISHRAWEGAGPPYIHTVAPEKDLDRRAGAKGSLAPHDELQRFLNASPQQWGVVTNGRVLRVLRDFHHTSVRGYIEFDLQGIFEDRARADFRALYRLAHVSRLVSGDDGKTPLEHLYDESTAAGVAIGGQLRDNVRAAIEELANGFLGGHPEVIAALRDDPEREAKAYYDEVLQVVYRLLFLLYAEQRGLLPGRNQLYQDSYSAAALRARAERPFRYDDPHGDLWEGLKVTFRLMRDGNAALAVPKLGGELFARGTDRYIDGMRCPNGVLLAAVRDLALVEREKVLQRISYVDLGVDELGSIYEALLDYQPRIATAAEQVPIDAAGKTARTVHPGEFFLDPRGMSRKSSGTYYTNPQLVDRLIQSALIPVLEERLSDAGDDRVAQEAALLDIKVVDPACGSGAFLIAAMNTLGLRLARVRSGEDYPPADVVDAARHDVLAHCIYGVDLNPTTVTLAKVSLWIAAAARDVPLTFLDHRIRCGNALVGATPELLAAGIPDESFTPVTGDDKDVAREARKANRDQRKAWGKGRGVQPGLRVTLLESVADLDCFLRVGQLADHDPEGARDLYESCFEAPGPLSAHQIADTWTAAFFWPLDGSEPPVTEQLFRELSFQGGALPRRTSEIVREIAASHRFFHWHLEFPDVFGRADPGFDVVVGNPPWDRVKLSQQEFFEVRSPKIAGAHNAATRKQMIARLADSLDDADRALFARFESAAKEAENTSLFLRESRRYPLGGRGDVNLYPVFAELDSDLIRTAGRVGIVVQTGIAVDDTNKELFAAFIGAQRLISLFDFDNREGIFPGIHRTHPKFCLLTIGGAGRFPQGDFAFYSTRVEHLDDPQRHFTLSATDLLLFNPNTQTCPMFRSVRDAAIAKRLYERWPVIKTEATSENPWALRLSRALDMGKAENVSRTLRARRDRALRIYESKLFVQYDHRFADYNGVEAASLDEGQPKEMSPRTKQDPAFLITPRRWFPQSELVGGDILPRVAGAEWLLAYRDITNSTNERTVIAAILPQSTPDYTVRLALQLEPSARRAALLLAVFNSITFDYLARLALNGTHLSDYVTHQLVVPNESRFDERLPSRATFSSLLVPRVMELTHTANDTVSFARALGHKGPPYSWNEGRRLEPRCEIDAVIAHLYQLDRPDLEWILDAQPPSESFRGLKHKEIAKWKEYRTMRLVLESYDLLAAGKPLPTDAPDKEQS